MPVGWIPPSSGGGGGGGGGGQSDLGLTKAGSADTVTVVNACTSTTNWSNTTTNEVGELVTTGMTTATVAGESCIGGGFRDGLVQYFRYDPPTPLAIPDSNLIRLRCAFYSQSSNRSEMYEIVVSDGAGWTGNVITFQMPAGMTVDQFCDITVPLTGLSAVAAVGIRTITPAYSVSGTSAVGVTFYISEIDFPDENGVSIGRAQGSTLVVPGDYTVTPAGYPYLDGVKPRLDFVANTIEGFRGVRHIRDYNFTNSGDVTAQLQSILGKLEPGDIFEFEPNATYQISGQIDLSHLNNVRIRGNNAAIQITGLFNAGIFLIGRDAENVVVEDLRIYGNRTTTTTADTLTDAAANMARPEVNTNGTVWIPVSSEWTAETNMGTPATGGGVKLDSFPNAMQLAPSGAGALSSCITATARRYPVTVGVSYTCEITATSYRTSSPVSRTMSLDLVWYDSGGSVLSTTTGTGQATPTANHSWVVLTVTGTAPASAAKVGVRINIANPTSSTERHYVERMVLTRNSAPTNAISSTSKILAAPGDALSFPNHATAAKHHFWARQPNGKNRWGVTLSGSSAQSDAALFRAIDKRTGYCVFAEYIDVTTSPVTTYIEWTPHDIEAPLDITIQNAAVATPITITVDSIFEYGRSDYNSGGDNMSGFVVEDNARRIQFHRIHVEGVYGDSIDATGEGVEDILVDGVLSRANGRQGISSNRGRNIRLYNLHIIGCGRSGIDIEPYQADWTVDGIDIANVRVAYTTNYALALSGWVRILNLSISNVSAIDCGAGLIIGGGRTASFSNITHRVSELTNIDYDVEMSGQDMVGNIVAGYGYKLNLDSGKTVMGGDGILNTFYPRPCPDLKISVAPLNLDQFHNLAYVYTSNDGIPQRLTGGIFDPGTNPNYDLSTAPFYSGAIKSESAGVEVVDFDPGPLRRWWPNTFKGVMNQGLHFYGGFDLKGEPVISTRSLSATTTRGSNLRGIGESVTLAATSKTVTFPASSGSHPTTIDSVVSLVTAGAVATLTLVPTTTYHWKVAPILERGRGPSAAAAATASVTFSGSNPARLGLKQLLAPEPDAAATGYLPYGWVLYRSEDGGTSYNVRYTITPTVDFPSVANTTYFYDYGGVLATDTSNVNVTGWSNYNSEANSGLPVDESGYEPDDDYAIAITPNWDTTVYVTSKSRSGFTVEFGTAAPASATFDWVLVR